MNTSTDPLDQLNPFSLLMDARHQLIDAAQAAMSTAPDRAAIALGAVVAYDDALREIARAFADGARSFEGIATPAERATGATIDGVIEARNALFEVLSSTGVSFTDEVDVPWAGVESWHIHLIGLAMFEGAQAHALREGDELPARLSR
ncbi:MAG: hypothetical protein H6675_04625 [Dehalococcoidia bacterium]|nr:hypothetical protein [Dehalococcoidia bacterium]